MNDGGAQPEVHGIHGDARLGLEFDDRFESLPRSFSTSAATAFASEPSKKVWSNCRKAERLTCSRERVGR